MVSTTTDIGRGVAVSEGDEPAAAENNTPEILDWTLAQRLAAIRDESYAIGKDTIKMKSKAGVEYTIKGHTVEAVLSEMRPLFSRYRVDMTPNLVERTYSGNRCDVMIDFMFESLDDVTDTRTIRWAGAGCDDGDKGFSKAGTNALKEMLKKRFLITDREDAKEEEDKVQHQTEDAASRKALESAKEDRRAAIERWAATFKEALKSAPDLDTVKRLQRDNAVQLSSEDLPPVTRTFFIELIEKRKAELALPA